MLRHVFSSHVKGNHRPWRREWRGETACHHPAQSPLDSVSSSATEKFKLPGPFLTSSQLHRQITVMAANVRLLEVTEITRRPQTKHHWWSWLQPFSSKLHVLYLSDQCTDVKKCVLMCTFSTASWAGVARFTQWAQIAVCIKAECNRCSLNASHASNQCPRTIKGPRAGGFGDSSHALYSFFTAGLIGFIVVTA